MYEIGFYTSGSDRQPIVYAIRAGYRATLNTLLERQPDGSFRGVAQGMAPAAVGYEGRTDSAFVPAEVIAQAKEIASANGWKNIRWNGEKFFIQ